LLDKRKWFESMQKAIKPADPRHEAAMTVLNDLWVVMAANCERGGKWASSVLMAKKEPPKLDWSKVDKDKEIDSLAALIEKNEDD